MVAWNKQQHLGQPLAELVQGKFSSPCETSRSSHRMKSYLIPPHQARGTGSLAASRKIKRNLTKTFCASEEEEVGETLGAQCGDKAVSGLQEGH